MPHGVDDRRNAISRDDIDQLKDMLQCYVLQYFLPQAALMGKLSIT